MGGPAEVAPSPPLVHGSTLPKQLFAGLGQTQPDADGFGAFGPGACTGALDRPRTQHFSTARVVVLLTTTPPPLWLAPFAAPSPTPPGRCHELDNFSRHLCG